MFWVGAVVAQARSTKEFHAAIAAKALGAVPCAISPMRGSRRSESDARPAEAPRSCTGNQRTDRDGCCYCDTGNRCVLRKYWQRSINRCAWSQRQAKRYEEIQRTGTGSLPGPPMLTQMLTWLETERLMLAQLHPGYMQARYGIALPGPDGTADGLAAGPLCQRMHHKGRLLYRPRPMRRPRKSTIPPRFLLIAIQPVSQRYTDGRCCA